MISLFYNQEVYIGFSMKDFCEVRDCLSLNHIKYSYKVFDNTAHSRGIFGSFGMNLNCQKQYYVYVKRKEYEKAKYLVEKTLNKL